ncbi:nucleotidyl transferase AbiEii/AbiGii toxin family protein [Crassaminicella profunda]|uniref:nucleotidyl transferase AbiEii/AbiGii toxin family protein n=1 Tax=Crassaminicella profunda TaxID=1286698 RepID=UPI001CA6BF35|nr:nucleotidyl transferase AbiEii/AbiGii toxin family protein [Crassaminicella profunda]QZY55139.1 nucleotidyl transferase AbiEii/AbiGii toxin family protein [Crassaminicella profunda]
MISNKTFTKEWINDRSNYFKRGRKQADPQLIEKVINALYLLENLTKTKLEFIFKGGTSLLLLLNVIHRFSIDIDIIIEDKNNIDLGNLCNTIVENNPVFYRYEEMKRNTSKNIPKAHYKFFYKSVLDEKEKYILLDILYEKNPYTELVEKEIDCEFLMTEREPARVTMPSIDCILGDKMTAFAPNTTGIPYGVKKELEIIKQLFDVSNLFDEVNNLQVVKDTFIKIANQELEYRGLTDMSFDNVLDDIIETSIIVAFRGGIKKDKYRQLEEGVKRIKGYIFTKNYIIEEAVLSAAKTAYLSLLIKNSVLGMEYFDSKIDVKSLNIDQPIFRRSFKAIKKFSPEGYYYWYKALELYENKEVASTKE